MSLQQDVLTMILSDLRKDIQGNVNSKYLHEMEPTMSLFDYLIYTYCILYY